MGMFDQPPGMLGQPNASALGAPPNLLSPQAQQALTMMQGAGPQQLPGGAPGMPLGGGMMRPPMGGGAPSGQMNPMLAMILSNPQIRAQLMQMLGGGGAPQAPMAPGMAPGMPPGGGMMPGGGGAPGSFFPR